VHAAQLRRHRYWSAGAVQLGSTRRRRARRPVIPRGCGAVCEHRLGQKHSRVHTDALRFMPLRTLTIYQRHASSLHSGMSQSDSCLCAHK
jgi:hypothetical protein